LGNSQVVDDGTSVLINRTTNNGLGTLQVGGGIWSSASIRGLSGVFGSLSSPAYALTVIETNAFDVIGYVENRSVNGFGVAINNYSNSNNYILNASGNNGTSRLWVASNGKIGVGTTNPATSAILDITSTTQGVLFPRMTTTQRDAISSPTAGLMIFNTTADKLQVRTSSSWVDLH
jgi:hypothetical protein